MKDPHPVDTYINAFPSEVKERLLAIRKAIHELVPAATEAMTYGIPTFKFHGNLVHFAGFDKHIGFYPTPSGIQAFKEELRLYKNAKGSVQFPHDQPLPLDLIIRISKFRIEENQINRE
jgi:uncharacterized protein YdhG (YjbR/CyaY superfamily)